MITYTRTRNQSRNACRKARNQMEKGIAIKVKKNPKGFWSHVKSNTKCQTGISTLKKANGEKTKTDKEKADTLKETFDSVFVREDNGALPEPPEYTFDQPSASHRYRRRKNQDPPTETKSQ